METPEQRAEKAERLREFRELSDVMLDQFYSEGKTPFNIPREEALAKSAERTFRAVEGEGLEVDVEFLKDAQSVLEAVNTASGRDFVVGEYPLAVLEYHLALAAGEEPSTELDIGYIRGEMEKHYKKTTGQTLENWARAYHEAHPDKTIDTKANLSFIKAFENDFEGHKFNEANLAKSFREFARDQGVDTLTPDVVMKLLAEKGFIVPSEWKEEFTEIEDGKTVITAIENAKRSLQMEEIILELEGAYADLPREDLVGTTITAKDVLAVTSFGAEVPENWNECDEQTQKVVSSVLSALAKSLGGKLGKSKGEPIVKL